MKKILQVVFIAAILSACGTDRKQEPTSVPEKSNENATFEKTVVLELNAGKKWQVNSEMMVHVKNMEKDILAFKGESVQEYRELAEKIKGHIGELTSACTMTGPSHEELHKWLHPFIELNEKLVNSDSTDQALKYYEEIKKQMEIFHQYFE